MRNRVKSHLIRSLSLSIVIERPKKAAPVWRSYSASSESTKLMRSPEAMQHGRLTTTQLSRARIRTRNQIPVRTPLANASERGSFPYRDLGVSPLLLLIK
jgi:hypothetical protein